ncbi:hypothetical protein ACH4EC_15230 [Streptomyces anulatus]
MLGEFARPFQQAEVLLEDELPERDDTDVYGVGGADVSRYQDLFDAARTSTLSPAESRAVIHRRAEEHQA